jgi:hypothetical protein
VGFRFFAAPARRGAADDELLFRLLGHGSETGCFWRLAGGLAKL